MKATFLAGALAAISAPAAAQAPPPASSWEPAVEAYFARTLKDPYSAVKRQTSTVFRASTPIPAGRERVRPWAVCFMVNAKNSYGAYVGEQPYLILLTDAGQVSAVLSSGSAGGFARIEGAAARKECAYAFPPAPKPRQSEFPVPAGSPTPVAGAVEPPAR